MDLPGTPLYSYPRGKTPIDEIVIHESVNRTREGTVAELARKRLGVHLIVERDGSITQHVPFDRACAHAEGFGKASLHNERSIAVEVINRYYGEHAAKDEVVIDAVWAHKGRYILPTPMQCEAVWTRVEQLCATFGIPLVFPGIRRLLGVGPRRFVWGRLSKHEVPGVMAHHHWDHADALFPEHYCAMRSLGWGPTEAWHRTVDAASSGKRETSVEVPG